MGPQNGHSNGHSTGDGHGAGFSHPMVPGASQVGSGALTPVFDEARLRAVERVETLRPVLNGVFDGLTTLATTTLHVPGAAVTLVGADRQSFLSAVGLPGPSARVQDVPLEYSLCKYVVASRSPVLIPDARRSPVVARHPAVTELGLIAYAGAPLRTHDGHCLGAFAVFTFVPCDWGEEALTVLCALSRAVSREIDHELDVERALEQAHRERDRLERALRDRDKAWAAKATEILGCARAVASRASGMLADSAAADGYAPHDVHALEASFDRSAESESAPSITPNAVLAQPQPIVSAKNPLLRFWVELKKRRVVRVGIVYLASAWLTIDVAGEVLPALGVPDRALTLVVIMAGIGFVLAVMTAWAFDMTPGGLVRSDNASSERGAEGADDAVDSPAQCACGASR